MVRYKRDEGTVSTPPGCYEYRPTAFLTSLTVRGYALFVKSNVFILRCMPEFALTVLASD